MTSHFHRSACSFIKSVKKAQHLWSTVPAFVSGRALPQGQHVQAELGTVFAGSAGSGPAAVNWNRLSVACESSFLSHSDEFLRFQSQLAFRDLESNKITLLHQGKDIEKSIKTFSKIAANRPTQTLIRLMITNHCQTGFRNAW